MQILILGAGAIGAYLGAYLGRCGQWVTLVGREPFVEAASRDGIHMQLPNGRSWQTSNFRAVSSLAEAAKSSGLYKLPYDVIVASVKAYDVDSAIQEIKTHESLICHAQGARDDGAVYGAVFLCFQNGVGSEERFATAFGAERVWAATTTSPVTAPQAGQVRVERASGAICLAPLIPNVSQAKVIDHLKEAAWSVRVYSDARALKWSKLLLNMMGNATSAILGLSPADIYAQPALYQFEIRALREAARVMQGMNISPVNLPHYPAGALAKAVRWLPSAILQPVLRRQLARGRGDKWPSFYYDVVNHSGKCEVGWLNGAIVECGRQLGIPTPVNQRLTDVLSRITHGEEDPSTWHGQVTKLVATPEQETKPQ